MRESWSKNKKEKKRKRELRRIYRHRDSMHWLKPTFLPELFELGYILLRKCISPRHQSLMAPSGLSAYPTPKFVGYVFIPRCAPLEKSVDTRAFPSLHAQRTRNTSGVRRAGLRCFAAGWFDYNEWSGNAMGRRMTCPPSPMNNWAGLAALRDISGLSCDSILAIIWELQVAESRENRSEAR